MQLYPPPPQKNLITSKTLLKNFEFVNEKNFYIPHNVNSVFQLPNSNKFLLFVNFYFMVWFSLFNDMGYLMPKLSL